MKAILRAAILCLCSSTMLGQTIFDGDLDKQLHVRSDWIRSEQWRPATEQDLALFTRTPNSTDKVWVWSYGVGQSALHFLSAVVISTDGRSCLYIDRRQAKHFDERDKTCFQPISGNTKYSGEAAMELPLPNGPYSSLTVQFRLPSDSANTPRDSRLTIMSLTNFYVEGYVRFPQKAMLMRFDFDAYTGNVDLKHGNVWLDLNGDGVLEDTGERDFADGKEAVFHVGDLYVKPKQINASEWRFTLQTVPSSEYQRFDLWKGGVLPNFEYKDLNGESHHLRDLKGKYLLLDFWATWCASCVADIGTLKVVYAKYHDRGLEVLGMHGYGGRDAAKEASRFVEKMQIPWPQAQAPVT